MAIRLYDSLTRDYKVLGQRELGAPPVSKEHPFTFYNCGPTVYGPAHIGNFRTFVVNDVLRRLLILEFGADQVRYVRNLTDVDDKTIRRAREEGRPLAEVTKQWTDKFHADCGALNCLPLDPQFEPTATGNIAEQRKMIEVLMQKGKAYCTADGSVFFKVSSFDGYGALSRVKERELKLGVSLKSSAFDADEKDDLTDFALWKAWRPEDGESKWPGPTGAVAGRPGWHIECSAMAKEHLGETIDLHSGGVDLLFPHHENEIAQSECCNGVRFSRHWYHSEFLLVDGKKMSKSLGNLYTLEDLSPKVASPADVRFALLAGHPRKQLSFSIEELKASRQSVTRLLLTLATLDPGWRLKGRQPDQQSHSKRFDDFWNQLRNDLNLPAARGALFSALENIPTDSTHDDFIRELYRALWVLGVDIELRSERPPIPGEIVALAEKRWAAKKIKDFATADALRKELAAAGWSMLDGKDGYKLEPLKK
jgi:cysteinyl-tRNA synthetase